jgi:hypothetical protein
VALRSQCSPWVATGNSGSGLKHRGSTGHVSTQFKRRSGGLMQYCFRRVDSGLHLSSGRPRACSMGHFADESPSPLVPPNFSERGNLFDLPPRHTHLRWLPTYPLSNNFARYLLASGFRSLDVRSQAKFGIYRAKDNVRHCFSRIRLQAIESRPQLLRPKAGFLERSVASQDRRQRDGGSSAFPSTS